MSRPVVESNSSCAESTYAFNPPAIIAAVLLAAALPAVPLIMAICFPALFVSTDQKVARIESETPAVESQVCATKPNTESEESAMTRANSLKKPVEPAANEPPPSKAAELTLAKCDATPEDLANAIFATHHLEPTNVSEDEAVSTEPIENANAAAPLPTMLDHKDAAELKASLMAASIRVDLETRSGTSAKLSASGRSSATPRKLPEAFAQRPDLLGLPFRDGTDCAAPRATAKIMTDVSRKIRSLANPFQKIDRVKGIARIIDQADLRDERYVAVFEQMLQVEQAEVRNRMVAALEGIEGEKASQALARRALYDLDREVRSAASEALRERPVDEYRNVLLDGLEYPWAPVAYHAAESLVALKDTEAVPHLVDLLEAPDPTAPYRGQDGNWQVRELVCVNHLRNCLLCHATSQSHRDTLRALIPTPGKTLPPFYFCPSKTDTFVRADVTYLKQDFSVMEEVSVPNRWPVMQRHDYLVRTRTLTENEASIGSLTSRAGESPHRRAVLFALRGITRHDAGDRGNQWRRWLRQQG